MSEKHGINEPILRNWANLGYITSSRVEEQLFLDEDSLLAYLETHKRLGLEADYLSRIVEEKKLERDFIISRYRHRITYERALQIYKSLLKSLNLKKDVLATY